MPELSTDHLTSLLRDAVYASIGVGVLSFQKAQVRRRELSEQVSTQLDSTREQLDSVSSFVEEQLKTIDQRLSTIEGRIESLVSELESRMPESAQGLVKQMVDSAKDAGGQVRSAVNRAA